DTDALVRRMLRNRDALRREAEAFRHEFNFLIVDGLSQREDALTAALSLGLGPVPLFGGSAGDGADFGAAFVLWQGQLYRNAAVLTQIRSRCPVRVFKSDHLRKSRLPMCRNECAIPEAEWFFYFHFLIF
ncbi:FIST N-terminal domain-containing protein, partial [Spongiibacter marinus]|uniref:FIST N-terminal domain-containing protein n=1 Tax=Spongiibacter marinus TaxID=354246 RepID=UPI0035BE43A6